MGPVSAQLMMVWVLCPCNGEGRGVADRVGFQRYGRLRKMRVLSAKGSLRSRRRASSLVYASHMAARLGIYRASTSPLSPRASPLVWGLVRLS
ncbi:unnamed protein product [Prunus armeniaca]|uniref:Uncharacterized protein n=1 Tax=Prunus armeniaca TaxID=36596 RepID=A0A6J5VBH7_PRUAR|nr:unnamed protein product [Prunus armeniaca]